MATREEVLQVVTNRVRVKHFSLRTEECYRHWIGRFYDFAQRLPAEWTSERKAEAFITDLAVRQRVAASTQNQAFAAVLFLYKEVLKKPLGDVHALRAKRPEWVREAPMGHAQLETTMGYIHRDVEKARSPLELLEALPIS